MSSEVDEFKVRIDCLKSQIERLRSAVIDCGMYIDDNHNREVLNKLLHETPTQSLNHTMAPLQKENDELKFTLNCAKDINAALETENDELKAHVERLHSITKEWKGLSINDARALVAFIELANSTSVQSLNHIKAQVEETTIEILSSAIEPTYPNAAKLLRSSKRKYKEHMKNETS